MEYTIKLKQTGAEEYTAELFNDNVSVCTYARRTAAHALLAISLMLCDEIDPTEDDGPDPIEDIYQGPTY
jgi:hypothetical protein